VSRCTNCKGQHQASVDDGTMWSTNSQTLLLLLSLLLLPLYSVCRGPTNKPAAQTPPPTLNSNEQQPRIHHHSTNDRIGDMVRFTGEYQDAAATMLTCRGFEVLVRWRDVAGGWSFEPRLAPRHRQRATTTDQPAQQQPLKQQQQQQQHSRDNQPAAPQSPAAPLASAAQQQSREPPPPAAAPPTADPPASQPPQPAVCKFFINSGRCLKGQDCPFAHLAADTRGQALVGWVKRRCGFAH